MRVRTVPFAIVAMTALTFAASEPAVYKTSAELMARLGERAKETPAPEMMAANVKSNGDKYMINVVRRTKPQGAIAHAVGSEIHSIIDGSATLVTGGTIVRPSSNPEDRGRGTIQNGVTRKVRKGDIIMVPPGTPHWYQAIDGMVTYLEIRFDVGAPSNGPAVSLASADVKKILGEKGSAANAPLMFDAPVARGDKWQANVVKRTKPQGGGAHELGTEVHQILEGSGTFVTGGTVVRASGANGPATIEGGESRHVGPGDVILIPANTPHWYKDVDGSITYLEVRFEVGKS
jgi:mannose-6-phosphate isomerase-like protein (cupin superfamily)